MYEVVVVPNGSVPEVDVVVVEVRTSVDGTDCGLAFGDSVGAAAFAVRGWDVLLVGLIAQTMATTRPIPMTRSPATVRRNRTLRVGLCFVTRSE